jgi:peptidyl-prolyl cis-trans isomerase C
LAVTQSLDLSTRVGGGDLGWFPRGVLTQPAVEEAAFALAPDEVSQVVESDLGYHLIEVIEREVRPLSANDLRRLRQAAVEEWLAAERQRAAIEILIEP